MERSTWKAKLGSLMLGLLLMAGSGLSSPSEATTLKRMSVEKLAATNTSVTIGTVVESRSYWNEGGTFILTDVVIEPDAVLKGQAVRGSRMVLTLMGGQVDDLATVIVGGASFELGKSYVIFSSVSDLPGAPSVSTVRDHSQGVFELIQSADGHLRAVSQASDQHLIADDRGQKSAPGGERGMDFDGLLRSIERGVSTDKNGQGVSQ
ncbi:MAG: hypothetical protein MPN21_17495 [Thermoanaerobaculia bacterium]|nr:hypothetical protein [Thermoanaerobaculia bacterium]